MGRGDARKPLQRFNAALCLLGFGCLGTEAADKIFQVRDFFLLLVESLILLRYALSAGALEIVVVSAVAINHMVVNMGNTVDAGIEKFAVMRNQNKAAGVASKVLFKPENRLQVEVIGGFIQQQQIGSMH